MNDAMAKYVVFLPKCEDVNCAHCNISNAEKAAELLAPRLFSNPSPIFVGLRPF
jgi:hypothetical protein